MIRLRICLLISTIIMMTAFPGCTFFPKEEEVLAPPVREPDKITYETVAAKRGDIEDMIRVSGTFVPVSQRDLYFKDRGGRLKEIHVVHGDEVKKGDLIAELETDAIEIDILLQEIALKKAQITYDYAKTRYDIEGGSRTEMELARLDVEANQIKLDNLRRELARSRLVSPIDGKIVYLTDTRLGEYINTYQTVVRIADPKQLHLVHSSDNINSFKLGMEVEVEIDSEKFTGRVVMTPNAMPEDADDQLINSVRMSVDNLPGDISIGKTATIKLTLQKQSNVIIIPKQVVNNFGNRKFVNVLKNNIREERDIEVGIENSTEVEVIKGLEEGELIIVR